MKKFDAKTTVFQGVFAQANLATGSRKETKVCFMWYRDMVPFDMFDYMVLPLWRCFEGESRQHTLQTLNMLWTS